MKLRRRKLPAGWYPEDEVSTRAMLHAWESGKKDENSNAVAGIVPHAGWAFSGEIAYNVFRKIRKETETVIIIGGHLPRGGGILAAFEEGFETPLGSIENDRDLLDKLYKEMELLPDTRNDNTVEIQLSFIKHFLPDARLLWLRVEHSLLSLALGESIYRVSALSGKKVAVLGSTDLTHYGPVYGFTPKGIGEDAVKWVKEVNDKKFIEAVEKMDLNEVIEISKRDRSACSAGGAVSSAAFAKKSGINSGYLCAYRTSYDIEPSESFVGYAGIVFEGH